MSDQELEHNMYLYSYTTYTTITHNLENLISNLLFLISKCKTNYI